MATMPYYTVPDDVFEDQDLFVWRSFYGMRIPAEATH